MPSSPVSYLVFVDALNGKGAVIENVISTFTDGYAGTHVIHVWGKLASPADVVASDLLPGSEHAYDGADHVCPAGDGVSRIRHPARRLTQWTAFRIGTDARRYGY